MVGAGAVAAAGTAVAAGEDTGAEAAATGELASVEDGEGAAEALASLLGE